MDYGKGILSGLAEIFVAEFVFFWPTLSREKATGLAVLKFLLVKSVFSPKFWIVGVLLFGLFFAASRGTTVIRVLFFWIPTLTVSALGFSIVAMYVYLFTISRHQVPPKSRTRLIVEISEIKGDLNEAAARRTLARVSWWVEECCLRLR